MSIRWLGPYKPTDRHMDDTSLKEFIKLRTEIDDLKNRIERTKKFASEAYWFADTKKESYFFYQILKELDGDVE
jgi:hypothetical protein